MNNGWQKTAIIAPGGTVFNIAGDVAGKLWLATEAGIFEQTDDSSWSPLIQGQPLTQVNAIASTGAVLLAGGSGGQLVYSRDGGQNWYQGRVSQTDAPITCLAAAPNFQHTGVILAGTDGSGILRSTDGGRGWQLANFGLQDFTVLALATAPRWDRRELAWAATARGFYRSPNGGRAWQPVESGLQGTAVQAIAVSPDFGYDHTVLVGTEYHGIFRSTDGGKSWQPWSEGLSPAGSTELPSINGLWLHPDFAARPICLAGAGNGQIFYSDNGGASWQQVAEAAGAVLCLGGTPQVLYAGLHEQGLLRSTDQGQSWQPVANLAARAITRLERGPDRQLFAFGPLAGAWRSVDGGQRWEQLATLAEQTPLITLAAAEQQTPCLLAGTSAGLQQSVDGGQSWQMVWPEVEPAAICFSPDFVQDGQVWVGTSTGEVLASPDGGQSWLAQPGPKAGQAVVAMAILPQTGPAQGKLLIAVTYAASQQQLTLWRSIDGGSSWQQWQQVSVNWPVAQIKPVGRRGERVLVCLDRRGWCSTASGWERVLETDQPILQLERLPEEHGFIALTPRQLLYSPDGLSWSTWDAGLTGQQMLDLAVSPTAEGQTVSVLTTGGVLWQRRF